MEDMMFRVKLYSAIVLAIIVVVFLGLTTAGLMGCEPAMCPDGNGGYVVCPMDVQQCSDCAECNKDPGPGSSAPTDGSAPLPLDGGLDVTTDGGGSVQPSDGGVVSGECDNGIGCCVSHCVKLCISNPCCRRHCVHLCKGE